MRSGPSSTWPEACCLSHPLIDSVRAKSFPVSCKTHSPPARTAITTLTQATGCVPIARVARLRSEPSPLPSSDLSTTRRVVCSVRSHVPAPGMACRSFSHARRSASLECMTKFPVGFAVEDKSPRRTRLRVLRRNPKTPVRRSAVLCLVRIQLICDDLEFFLLDDSASDEFVGPPE
jgi:hypothetical protein